MRITRIYADNFRCLQNFELQLNPVMLLMGLNGSGKSTVLTVFHRIRQMLSGEDVRLLFPRQDLTDWDHRSEQFFEVDIEDGTDRFKYSVTLRHDRERNWCRVYQERFEANDTLLYKNDGNSTQLFRDNGSMGPQVISDWHRSGISQLQERHDNQTVSRFRTTISRWIVGSIAPVLMKPRSEREVSVPDVQFTDFTSWLRRVSDEYQKEYFDLNRRLSNSVLPGFHSFQFESVGEGEKDFYLNFEDNGGRSRTRIRIDRLSDGQRVLIVLYALLAFAEYHPFVCLDEPQNYVALQEIQPWLMEALDRFEDVGGQLIISSHSSEFINLLAPQYGVWLQRSPMGPTRAGDVDFLKDGLPAAETVARGWTDE